MKHILSIDGGGIRGVIPGLVLQEIEKQTGFRTAQLFDIVAGTSTGGILTLCLLKPQVGSPWQSEFTANQAVEIYSDCGTEIFSPKERFYGKMIWNQLAQKARYSSDGIDSVLARYFGDSYLSTALKPALVLSLDTNQTSVFEFYSERAKLHASDDYFMRNVARATSAAPTFFQPAEVRNRANTATRSLIDGGLIVNNPAQEAHQKIVNQFPKDKTLVLSLGTGSASYNNRLTHAVAKHLLPVSWARRLTAMTMDATSKRVHSNMMKLLPSEVCHSGACHNLRYIRLQSKLEPGCEEMDDASPSNVDKLRIIAEELIEDNSDLLITLCQRLKQSCVTAMDSRLLQLSSLEQAAVHRRLGGPQTFAVNLSNRLLQSLHEAQLLEISASTATWSPHFWRLIQSSAGSKYRADWEIASGGLGTLNHSEEEDLSEFTS